MREMPSRRAEGQVVCGGGEEEERKDGRTGEKARAKPQAWVGMQCLLGVLHGDVVFGGLEVGGQVPLRHSHAGRHDLTYLPSIASGHSLTEQVLASAHLSAPSHSHSTELQVISKKQQDRTVAGRAREFGTLHASHLALTSLEYLQLHRP